MKSGPPAGSTRTVHAGGGGWRKEAGRLTLGDRITATGPSAAAMVGKAG